MIPLFRMDGSPYEDTEEGQLEWFEDMNDGRGRTVRQELLWNGLWVSTVWTGLPSARSIMSEVPSPHGTFETMVFDYLGREGAIVDSWKWGALDEAERGHYSVRAVVATIRFTLGYWWYCLKAECSPEEHEY